MLGIWPPRTLGGITRLSILIILFLFTLKLSYDLSRFDPGSVYFSTMKALVNRVAR